MCGELNIGSRVFNVVANVERKKTDFMILSAVQWDRGFVKENDGVRAMLSK